MKTIRLRVEINQDLKDKMNKFNMQNSTGKFDGVESDEVEDFNLIAHT